MNETVLVDVVRDGKPLHALFHADRNGQFVVLDRVSGKFVYATPMVKTTGVTGYDSNGVPRVSDSARIVNGKPADVCPSAIGGKNWWPTAFDPTLGLAYVPVSHMCMTISPAELDPRVGAAVSGLRLQAARRARLGRFRRSAGDRRRHGREALVAPLEAPLVRRHARDGR